MRLPSRRYPSVTISTAFKQPWLKRLVLYSIILMFLGLGDAIMTYFSPVYINQYVKNEMVMGIIIATSSMVGLVCDILFGAFLKGKPHNYFLIRSVIVASLFAVSFLLFPPLVPLLVMSMAFWGVYYELMLFSDFHFINQNLDHPHHSAGWSVLKSFAGISYMVGPLIAGFLYAQNENLPPLGALLMLFIALVLFLLFRKNINKRSPIDEHQMNEKRNLFHEFKIWRLLLPKLWPIMLFVLVMTMMDAAFWTVGSVLAEDMNQTSSLGGLLIIAYMLPALFAGYLSGGLTFRFGKKRTAFVAGVATGLLFLVSGLVISPLLFILFIFIASTFQGMAVIEIFSAIEDYLERLGHSSNALVGLENSTTSIAFIIGPIFAGLVATIMSERAMFVVMGILITLASLLALFIVPRKIRLPETAIAQVGG